MEGWRDGEMDGGMEGWRQEERDREMEECREGGGRGGGSEGVPCFVGDSEARVRELAVEGEHFSAQLHEHSLLLVVDLPGPCCWSAKNTCLASNW